PTVLPLAQPLDPNSQGPTFVLNRHLNLSLHWPACHLALPSTPPQHFQPCQYAQ
ncbi:hypothetical protein CALCODRAFT_500577, partial [Calocera cornea HHB12733]